MPKTFNIINVINDEPAFDVPIKKMWQGCKKGGVFKYLDPAEAHTDRQRKWFKGVLLKELSKDNGDSVRQWEIKLIAAIFPEDIKYMAVNKQVFPVAPSVSTYGKKKMTELIEESVPMCHEWGFSWVTYPDEELRK